MGNSESTCSPHEDVCKEAETKLIECALAHLVTKEFTKGFKAAFNDDYAKFVDYMKRGPCKESYMTWVKSTDKDSHDKHMTLMECTQAHSDYYHKSLDFYKGVKERVMKELKSINQDDETPIRVQEFLGDCCKEQYSAAFRCYMKEI